MRLARVSWSRSAAGDTQHRLGLSGGTTQAEFLYVGFAHATCGGMGLARTGRLPGGVPRMGLLT